MSERERGARERERGGQEHQERQLEGMYSGLIYVRTYNQTVDNIPVLMIVHLLIEGSKSLTMSLIFR